MSEMVERFYVSAPSIRINAVVIIETQYIIEDTCTIYSAVYAYKCVCVVTENFTVG